MQIRSPYSLPTLFNRSRYSRIHLHAPGTPHPFQHIPRWKVAKTWDFRRNYRFIQITIFPTQLFVSYSIAPIPPTNVLAMNESSTSIVVTSWNKSSSGECNIKYDVCICKASANCESTSLDLSLSNSDECLQELDKSMPMFWCNFLNLLLAFPCLFLGVFATHPLCYCLKVRNVRFFNLERFTDYNVFVRSTALQSQIDALDSREKSDGNFSTATLIRTSEDGTSVRFDYTEFFFEASNSDHVQISIFKLEIESLQLIAQMRLPFQCLLFTNKRGSSNIIERWNFLEESRV